MLLFNGRVGKQHVLLECSIVDAKVLVNDSEELGMIVQLTPGGTTEAGLIGNVRFEPVLRQESPRRYAKPANEPLLRSFLTKSCPTQYGSSLTPQKIIFVWQYPQKLSGLAKPLIEYA
jgi:hypothetical protein